MPPRKGEEEGEEETHQHHSKTVVVAVTAAAAAAAEEGGGRKGAMFISVGHLGRRKWFSLRSAAPAQFSQRFRYYYSRKGKEGLKVPPPPGSVSD